MKKIKNVIIPIIAFLMVFVMYAPNVSSADGKIGKSLKASHYDVEGYSDTDGTPVDIIIYKSIKTMNSGVKSMANDLVESARLVRKVNDEFLRITFKQVYYKPAESTENTYLPSYINRIVYSPNFKHIRIKGGLKYKDEVAEGEVKSFYSVKESDLGDVDNKDKERYIGEKIRVVEVPVREMLCPDGKVHKVTYLAFEVPAMEQIMGEGTKKSADVVIE